MQFGFDPNGESGHRVVIDTVKVQGKSLDMNKTYLVAMKEYLAKVFIYIPSLFSFKATSDCYVTLCWNTITLLLALFTYCSNLFD